MWYELLVIYNKFQNISLLERFQVSQKWYQLSIKLHFYFHIFLLASASVHIDKIMLWDFPTRLLLLHNFYFIMTIFVTNTTSRLIIASQPVCLSLILFLCISLTCKVCNIFDSVLRDSLSGLIFGQAILCKGFAFCRRHFYIVFLLAICL